MCALRAEPERERATLTCICRVARRRVRCGWSARPGWLGRRLMSRDSSLSKQPANCGKKYTRRARAPHKKYIKCSTGSTPQPAPSLMTNARPFLFFNIYNLISPRGNAALRHQSRPFQIKFSFARSRNIFFSLAALMRWRVFYSFVSFRETGF